MRISEIKKVDKELIEYIYSKISKGYSISSILREELGKDTPKKEIERKRKYISKKISLSGYKFNKEKKIYELPVTILEDMKEEIIEKESEHKIDHIEEIIIDEIPKSKPKPKRKYTKKRDKEIADKMKDNPLLNEIDLYSLIADIDFIYGQNLVDPKTIGVYINQNIVNLFEVVVQRYKYLDFYLLANKAIYSCCRQSDKLVDGSWLIEYSKFIADNKKNKKTVNLKSNKMIDNEIFFFLQKNPLLKSRSEVVNFSLYVYAQCYLKNHPIKDKESQQ